MEASAGPLGRLRLLLDVHHSRLAAQRLRAGGYDVTAAADDPGLAALSDEELLRAAWQQQRALVTENVKDFDRIVRSWSSTGEHHAGVVFTSPRHCRRSTRAYPANLVAGLATLLDEPPGETTDLVLWIP